MSKLFLLKEWITIPEATNRLTSIINDEVSEADVLQLGIDGKLVISVNFVNYEPVRTCRNAKSPEKTDSGALLTYKKSNNDEWIEIDIWPITHVIGIHDLSMLGGEIDILTERYQGLTGGQKIVRKREIGAILSDGSNLYELCKYIGSEEYEPFDDNLSPFQFESTSLSSVYQLVVKTSEIEKFEKNYIFTRLTPEKIVERERKAGKNAEQIASVIDSEYKGSDHLTNDEMGLLLPANPGTSISKASSEQRGKRLRGKKT